MMKASDAMSTDVFCLDADAPISSASWEMNAEFISGAPVRDPDGQIIGMLSKTDLAERNTLPTARVRDLMTPNVATVQPDTPIAEVVRLMLDRGIHRVVVVDSDGALSGIVSPLDILRRLNQSGALDSI